MRKLSFQSLAAALAAVGCAMAPRASLLAQGGPRRSAPAGQEIADRVKSATLDRVNAAMGQVRGKRITLTPVVPTKASGDPQAGVILGVMDSEIAGDETGLPPGHYDLFATQVGAVWHVYAESNGQIVKEAVRVKVDKVEGGLGARKPQFHAPGWGWTANINPDTSGNYCTPGSYTYVSVANLLVGQTAQLTASTSTTDRYCNTTARTGLTYTWKADSPAVATVSSTGLVTGVAHGISPIHATAGYYTGVGNVAVNQITVVASPSAVSVPVGTTAQLKATVYLNGVVQSQPVSWLSINRNIATVSSTGLVTGVGGGSTEVTARDPTSGQSASVLVSVPLTLFHYSTDFYW